MFWMLDVIRLCRPVGVTGMRWWKKRCAGTVEGRFMELEGFFYAKHRPQPFESAAEVLECPFGIFLGQNMPDLSLSRLRHALFS